VNEGIRRHPKFGWAISPRSLQIVIDRLIYNLFLLHIHFKEESSGRDSSARFSHLFNMIGDFKFEFYLLINNLMKGLFETSSCISFLLGTSDTGFSTLAVPFSTFSFATFS
jgi:hypothetical protein